MKRGYRLAVPSVNILERLLKVLAGTSKSSVILRPVRRYWGNSSLSFGVDVARRDEPGRAPVALSWLALLRPAVCDHHDVSEPMRKVG